MKIRIEIEIYIEIYIEILKIYESGKIGNSDEFSTFIFQNVYSNSLAPAFGRRRAGRLRRPAGVGDRKTERKREKEREREQQFPGPAGRARGVPMRCDSGRFKGRGVFGAFRKALEVFEGFPVGPRNRGETGFPRYPAASAICE